MLRAYSEVPTDDEPKLPWWAEAGLTMDEAAALEAEEAAERAWQEDEYIA